MPFDPDALEVTGAPVPVVTRVSMAGVGPPVSRNIDGLAFFDVSRSGALVYAQDLAASAKHSLVWLDRDGSVEELASERDDYRPALALSGDGRRLAVVRPGQGFDNLWVFDSVRRWHQLTVGWNVSTPLWAPAGDRIVFACSRGAQHGICVMPSNGDGQPALVWPAAHDGARIPSGWSPDGSLLAYQEQRATGWDTWIAAWDGSREPWRLDAEGKNVTLATFSPDGRWIAYQANNNETAQFEVYIRPFPGPGSKRLMSGQFGGIGPAWSDDGTELLFLTPALDDRRVMGVAVAGSNLGPAPAAPRVAFALPFDAHPAVFPYLRRVFAVAPGGRRVALVRPDPQSPYEIQSLIVVPGWRHEVTAKLAGR